MQEHDKNVSSIRLITIGILALLSWKLEAGDDENRQVIASGDKIGKNLNFNLEEPVTAKVLRLVMEKSKEQAGIRELEVY